MSTPSMDLYVYYKAPVDMADRIVAAVRTMQEIISGEQGVRGTLKRRPEPKDGLHTWMEIYPALPEAFDETLDRAVARAGLAELIVGSRHLEYFMDGFTCA